MKGRNQRALDRTVCASVSRAGPGETDGIGGGNKQPVRRERTFRYQRAETLEPLEFQSFAINRRSRCGSVRGSPVLNSHFSPGSAPQVGQRTARICFGLSSFFMAKRVSENTYVERSILNVSPVQQVWRNLAHPKPTALHGTL